MIACCKHYKVQLCHLVALHAPQSRLGLSFALCRCLCSFWLLFLDKLVLGELNFAILWYFFVDVVRLFEIWSCIALEWFGFCGSQIGHFVESDRAARALKLERIWEAHVFHSLIGGIVGSCEGSLRGAWDLLGNFLAIVLVHAKLNNGFPVLGSQEVVIHDGDDIWNALL
jgi:hypothetical protein